MDRAQRLTTKNRIAGLMLSAVLALAAGGRPQAGDTQSQDDFIEIAEGAYALSPPDPIAPFRMTTHAGRPFDNSGLAGKWSFLFFGFTHCPDICPTTLAVFADIHRRLAQRPHGTADVQFILVSVDPERDSPERLQRFVAAFNPEFIGLTGDAVNLARLSDSVGAMYAKAPGPSAEEYLMNHSSAVLLTDPDGRLHAIFAAPHTPANMLQAFLRIRARAQQGVGTGVARESPDAAAAAPSGAKRRAP